MTTAELLAAYGALLVTGLVMSLHCIGMCGPIVIGFSQAFRKADGAAALTVEGKPVQRRAQGIAWDFVWYHTGRIWTYALLGLIAGFAGAALRHGSALVGWHQAAGIAIGVVVIIGGLALLGLIPGIDPDSLMHRCGIAPTSSRTDEPGHDADSSNTPPSRDRFAWLRALLAARGPMPRLLLGAVMGFLPCGLVYAMLAIVAAMPTPLHAAGGMIAFGIGTLPSLSAVILATRLVPARFADRGMKLAAILVVATGLWMTTRSVLLHDHDHAHADHSTAPDHTGHDMHHHD